MTAGQRVHLVGVGGIHMSGIARLLLDLECRVSGSDLAASHLTEALQAQGATIHIGHQAEHVTGADLVVRTAAVRDDNPEIVAARAMGIPVLSRAEMVARLSAGRTVLTVAGTHGKTTTATLLTLILREAGLGPSFLLGGESADLGTHAAFGAGDAMVLEADEYGAAFLHYQPRVAVITNIERDHLDFYKTDDALQAAYADYARTLVADGVLIVGAESPWARRVAEGVRAERDDLTIETFAAEGEATWQAEAVVLGEGTSRFALRRAGALLGSVAMQAPGLFNIRNALAATAAAIHAGADAAAAARALARFQGVRRRFQRLGEAGGVLVMDDYAHHPTEIAATIGAARQRFPGRRLVVLFQPHTYSRSQYLLESFRPCFRGADALYLTDTYAARERPEAGLSAVDLAAEIRQPGAIYVGGLAEAVETVARGLRPGDVCFTIGAGDVEEAGPRLLERLGAR